MDASFTLTGAETQGAFLDTLSILKPYTAWTSGNWNFQPTPKQWSEVQNTSKDISQLRDYLYSCLANEMRQAKLAKEATA